jgi:ABC-type multidrug transport system fused ATPase/permease subunit
MQFTTCFITTLSLIPYIVIEYPKAKASYSRLSAVMNAKDADTGVEKDVDQGGLAVEICDLTLTDNLGKKSLDGVALTIPKGGFVSLVGPNGCGGYNVAMTMLGFNKPVSGEVSVCGLDALRSSPELIRSRISYVSNSINILEGTMRFNLDPHGLNTDEEIMEICRKVGLDSFIDDLPNGLDSIVSDSKSSLSGGQKQLVLIARGLLKHPELYIFENCFYSLDVKTRERVFRTIKEIKDSTVVFVMNDTWTCNDSSKVILMDCGRVSDVGTHEELLRRSRLYADMCKFGQMKEGTWA